MTTVPAPEGVARGVAESTAGGSRATARVTQPVRMTQIRLVGDRGGKSAFLSPRRGGGRPGAGRRYSSPRDCRQATTCRLTRRPVEKVRLRLLSLTVRRLQD